MPPRYAYWTIIAGGLPTAFRASQREELLPTFHRIREKHPDAQMKWFARGKLWESPEAARVRHDDSRGRRPFGDTRAGEPRDRDRKGGAKPEGPPAGERRGRDWRPGGEHRDPRQKFVDAKKQKNAALRKDRWERKNAPPQPTRDSRARPAADRNAKPPGANVEARRPQGKGGWRPKPEGWDRKPGFRGRSADEPREEPRPRGPNREQRRSETPAPPPRPDNPNVPPAGPSERGHIKHRRPFQPRGGIPKRPRRP